MNKFGAIKTVNNGITFHSRGESERYSELLILQKAGLIKDLELQPVFELQSSFCYKGKKVSSITYIADFKYLEVDSGMCVIEDFKGFETKDFLIKKKLFLKKYGDLYDFRIVK